MVARFVPHGNWRTHLLANSPVGGCWARRAPGCDLSDPSQVMEPRSPTSHTSTAMDPVHGSQSSFGSTDVTLTAQRGAVLMSSYGSESMGEVSMGTASTALTGQRNQPMDAARQPLLVNDSALWGLSALPGGSAFPGLSALPGQSFHSAAVQYMGIPPWKWKWGRPSAPRPCRTQGAFPFRVSLACPGPSPPSRELGHPRDSPAPLGVRGIFRLGANASHQAGTTPLQGSGNGRPPWLAGPIEHFPSGYLSPARGPALPLGS